MPDLTTAAGQLEHLTEGCVDVVRREDLAALLEKSLAAGKPLIVKVGFDPSSADIHLGHVVLMRKMKQFQECGHQVVFVVGDFTAMIGDPTGRSKTRPQLSREQILANAETYRRQAAKVLDVSKTQFRYNSEWLEGLGSVGLIRLAAKYNVARMLERRDFRQRFEAGQSIAVHEFLYPLAQAYDSVALAADVELGGTDQLFNLNVGRDIMPEYGLRAQIVMTTPLLEGLDGVEKMSKSLGNYVAVEDTPGEMYGKLMSISDQLMWTYWRLLGGLRGEHVEIVKAAVQAGSPQAGEPLVDYWMKVEKALNWKPERLDEAMRDLPGQDSQGRELPEKETPRDPRHRGAECLAALAERIHRQQSLDFRAMSLKKALARTIVADFQGSGAAEDAEQEWLRVHSQRQRPTTVERLGRPLAAEGYLVSKLITDLGLAKSNSEARRLILQGAVRVDGDVIASERHVLKADRPALHLIRVGPHRFLELQIG